MRVKQSVLKYLLGNLGRSRQKAPTYCVSLSRSFVIWFSKVKPSSSKIPQYFTQSVRVTFWPSNWRLSRFDFFFIGFRCKKRKFISYTNALDYNQMILKIFTLQNLSLATLNFLYTHFNSEFLVRIFNFEFLAHASLTLHRLYTYNDLF